MAWRSAEYPEATFTNQPDPRRARSHEHADFWEQQERLEHYERERKLQRRSDRYYGQPPVDRLFVPSVTPRRHQSRSTGETYEPPFLDPETKGLTVRQKKLRESIKVEIRPDPTEKPSAPFMSSQSALPQIHLQLVALLDKLSEISSQCSRNRFVEAASPQDLTFSKIIEQVNGYGFALNLWSHEVNMENLTDIDTSRRRVIESASRTLERLLDRAYQLGQACAKASASDLRFEPLPKVESDSEWESYDSEDEYIEPIGTKPNDPLESLGFQIKSHLDSISLQIQTLARLTRAIQDAMVVDRRVNPEVETVGKLVLEVDDFFGSPEALRRNSINEKFAGRKALEEARYAAGKPAGVGAF